MLSVVMPNFNHARFLAKALEALTTQRKIADEIIVIDDASTDDSTQIIEAYALRCPRIRLRKNTRRIGVVANVNLGLELAQGDLVFFAAADDLTYPMLFEKGVSLLCAFPQAAFFSARTDVIDTEGRGRGVIASQVPCTMDAFIPPSDVARLLLKDDSWFAGTTTIWRRDFLISAGGFLPELGAFADGYLARQMALKHGVCFSPDVLAAWRRMEGGVAWSEAIDLKRTQRLADFVERKMTEDCLFPQGYAKRWKGRHLFGARRFALALASRDAKKAGAVRYLFSCVRELILTAWFFAILRPADLLTVMNRRLFTVPTSSGKNEVTEKNSGST